MLQNENIYFSLFIYTILLYWIVAILVSIFLRLRKKKITGVAYLVFLGVIFFDLVVYDYFAIIGVVLDRKDITFNERKNEVILPESRKESLSFTDQFRYFRSALYKEFTAFHANRFAYFNQDNMKASFPELVEKIRDGDFVFYQEIRQLNALDFILMGKDNYEKWTEDKKLAYLNIFEVTVGSIIAHTIFVAELKPDSMANCTSYKLLHMIKKAIEQGYNCVENNEKIWLQKDLSIDIFRDLLTPNLVSKDSSSDLMLFNKVLIQHAYLFRNLPVYDYLNNLCQMYKLPNVNSFVITKEFAQLINIFEGDIANPKLSLIRKKIKKDTGISAPVINFFSEACFCDTLTYFKNLKKGEINEDVLYLEAADDDIHTSIQKQNQQEMGDPNFFYKLIYYNPNRLKLSCKVDKMGYLYFSDGYDKYWQANIDGVKIRVYRANGGFKAINLPKGVHVVEFIYNPVFFRIALWVYYIMTIGCALFIVLMPMVQKRG